MLGVNNASFDAIDKVTVFKMRERPGNLHAFAGIQVDDIFASNHNVTAVFGRHYESDDTIRQPVTVQVAYKDLWLVNDRIIGLFNPRFIFIE